MATKRRQALGKSLSALLGPTKTQEAQDFSGQEIQIEQNKRSMSVISLQAIKPNPHQPRQEFDSETLRELADSIAQAGLVQPLVVRRVGAGYEIVAGERRLRAAKLAGLTDVPCMVADVGEQDSLLLALIENLQREDLNPIEEAEAYASLRREFHLSQEAVAERVGKSRSTIANSLRLLSLPPEMIEDVRDGIITAGHARALLAITDEAQRREVWREIKKRGLSVRETELMCQRLGGGRGRQTSAFTGRPPDRGDEEAQALSEELMARLGVQVKIRRRSPARGRVELRFGTLEEFERILEILGLRVADRL